jgi:hypothetical protein
MLPFTRLLILIFLLSHYTGNAQTPDASIEKIKAGFANPPDEARPGVYWYFMDGNLSKQGITADLESMKRAGIGTVLFLEVNIGLPRGSIDFLSTEWRKLFAHAVHECERLGIEMVLGIGPGWSGSGGPWVKASESMQHLVTSRVTITGGQDQKIKLPLPLPKRPFFGEEVFTEELKQKWQDFYEDVMVLAFPAMDFAETLTDADEKALYYRPPYTSQPGVKQFFHTSHTYKTAPPSSVIQKEKIIDLTKNLHKDGTLYWNAPRGKWTIMRFGRRNNGAITRPAPLPGLGFEADKLDTTALNHHLANFTDKLLADIGIKNKNAKGGLKTLHIDSWEMGAQNWTAQFQNEFIKRRGYDPLPFFPAYAGLIVQSREISERFLWDIRQTVQEMVLDYHVLHLKKYSRRKGLNVSIEPYDMNPTADLALGAPADIPMGEFWANTFNSAFSCVEAASIGHITGAKLIGAESFTSVGGYTLYPGSMKNQGDWAFACGINKFLYHTYAHQPFSDTLKPGMTMGPYGVQWNRNQTWWPMVSAYHQYISRCQFMLRQGQPVADILYLTPEGAPHVFRAPASAYTGTDTMPDRKGYNFDGCAPGELYRASVKNNKIVFPGGASYELLVLPSSETMTPALLKKIRSLVKAGATVVGSAPKRSPSLSGYPFCDKEVQSLVQEIWGSANPPAKQTIRVYGKGQIVSGGEINTRIDNLYPDYTITAAILASKKIKKDFEADSTIRYTHRQSADWDIYFVSNRKDQFIKTDCIFRTSKGIPMLWDPVSGHTSYLSAFSSTDGQTRIPLQFHAYQSFFIVFGKNKTEGLPGKNFSELTTAKIIDGPWQLSFDTAWGGPANMIFDTLQDWTQRPENGIKYYSGIARYSKTFDFTDKKSSSGSRFFLNLGEVKNMARIKLNGVDLGILWTAPWTIEISALLKEKNNYLQIEIANLWPNRLIGDASLPDDGIKDGHWPHWLLNHQPRTSARYSFTTDQFYKKDAPLLKSGLIGPVSIQEARDK